MGNVLLVLEKARVIFSSIFRPTYVANKCAHKTKNKGFVKAGDQTTIMTMPLEENGSPDYCLDCISKMRIQCAWCGDGIIIGHPITLYIPRDTYAVPDYAVSYREGGCEALVGCVRGKCDPMIDRAGFWVPGKNGRGMVERVPTALEVIMTNLDAEAVVIHDMAEAVDPQVIKHE